MKALLVIDMQEDYVGENRNKKRYAYDTEMLISKVNARILEYQKDSHAVVYIRNKRMLKRNGTSVSELIKDLSIASDIIFDKSAASCFSNDSLVVFLKENDITEVEVVGVDGNYCVGMSALSAIKLGCSVVFPCSCVGISNKEKFIKTKERLLKANVKVCE